MSIYIHFMNRSYSTLHLQFVCPSIFPIHLKLYMRIYAWGKGPSNLNFKFKITKLWVGYFSLYFSVKVVVSPRPAPPPLKIVIDLPWTYNELHWKENHISLVGPFYWPFKSKFYFWHPLGYLYTYVVILVINASNHTRKANSHQK